LVVAPKFSVVIPTKERADTLRAALRTCLAQDYDDFEVVVCDNVGSTATRAVVESAHSPKVRYYCSSEPLAMSHNWELALSHARGEYITVLGDDDGLLGYALRALDRLIAEHRPRALRWETVLYTWPTLGVPEDANYLRLPLGRGLRVVEGRAAIAAVMRFEAEYQTLPMVYNAVVHRDLLWTLRDRTGRVFLNSQPDVYSGFAVAYLADRYLSTDVPMTVTGYSERSNGVAHQYLRGRHPVARDFQGLNARQGLRTHPWVPDLPIFPVVPVADSFQFAREALFPHDDNLRLDRKALVSRCVRDIVADSEDDWRDSFRIIRATLEDDRELLEWFDAAFAGCRPRLAKPPRLSSLHLGFRDGYLHLNASRFGITDVAGAARFCEALLCHGEEECPRRSLATADGAGL
jgi:hypothetical protein